MERLDLLPGALHRAGLALDPDVVASALTFVGRQTREWPVFAPILDRGVAAGLLDPRQAAAIEAAIATSADRGTAFVSTGVFGFVARRP